MKIRSTILLILLFGTVTLVSAQTEDTLKIKPYFHEVNPFVEDNEGCLKCHGEMKFTIVDSIYERTITKKMYAELYVDRDNYYSSVHKSFSCTDCHSYDFYTFPHNIEARTEAQLVCMDCHGYDETFAKYHFESIEVEFGESIHNMEEFTCWKCHDPHSYKAFMRNNSDLGEAILYDNNMCLKCHADFSQFMVLTDRDEINILSTHEWLPNQASHFAKVRCIECHTQINDTILIAHNILPKEEAVQNCTECHSKDSRLVHTLYKFDVKEQRKAGFVNSMMINNSYVIGANQNVTLNRLSILIFGLTLLVIMFHTYLRIRNAKKR
jgi:hypothetical protein